MAKFVLKIYTSPVLQMKEHLFIKEKNKTISSFINLKHKKLAIVKDYGTIPKIREKYPSIKIVETKNLEESVDFVLNGKVDALLESQLVATNYLEHSLITGIKGMSQNIFDASNLHFFINKNKPILHSILQKGLNSISEIEKNNIIRHWLHLDGSENLNTLTSKEKNYLHSKTNIKMCVNPDWMPFEKIINGKHVGIAADYIKVFQKKLGLPIDLVETKSWSESLEYAKNRKCDILSLAMSAPSRQKYMNFTKPYLKIPLILVTKKSITFLTDLKQLSNKTIGIQKGYGFNEIIKKKYPSINIINVDTLEKGFEKVEKGEIFGQISTNVSASYLFQSKFVGSLQITGKFDEKWLLGVGVRNDDKVLLGIFEKIVLSLSEDTKQKILNHWVSIKYEKGFDYSLFWKIFIVIVVIMLFIIYKHIILNKHNTELQTAKEEIEELNTTLEKRVKKRTKDLELKTLELEMLNNTLDMKVKAEMNKRKKQEQILIQQSRLAEMGEMISMIAHQWRQPLSALSIIIQNIHLSYSIGKLDEKFLKEQLIKGNTLTEKMSRTINDFRDFFKPNKEKIDFSLHAAIQQSIFLIDDSFRHNNIEINRELHEDVIIHGFANEFSQVILNILINAKDALLENKIQNPSISIRIEKGNDCGKIFISDNAGGIDSAIIDKIFEPYFTTKESHNGTGLGLYMSKMIVEQNMNGKLSTENKLPGAVFCINIPTNNSSQSKV